MRTTANLVPELQNYFEEYVNTSILNKGIISAPATIESPYDNIDNTSFVRLLFDDNWPVDATSYNYLYEEVNRSLYPWVVKTRLMVYNLIGKYWISDSTANQNIFELVSDDFRLLNKLLEYRTDQTCTIDDIVFDDLTTSLSKLIYIYLDLKLNDSCEHYNTPDIISNENEILANCYEAYIIENVFNFVSSRGT